MADKNVFHGFISERYGSASDAMTKIRQRLNDRTKLFNKVLERLNLKLDREGLPRTFYSLRHGYILFRLTEGINIVQLASNCCTSVEMIKKHYASAIKPGWMPRRSTCIAPVKSFSQRH
jgi:hypothetical protein